MADEMNQGTPLGQPAANGPQGVPPQQPATPFINYTNGPAYTTTGYEAAGYAPSQAPQTNDAPAGQDACAPSPYGQQIPNAAPGQPYAAPENPYAQQPFSQTPYAAPQQDNGTGMFVLSIVGLVLGVLTLSIPGLICDIVALVKTSSKERAGIVSPKTKPTKIISVIGIVVSSLTLIASLFIFAALGTLTAGLIAADQNGSLDEALNSLEQELDQELEGSGSYYDGYGSVVTDGVMAVGDDQVGYLQIPSSWQPFQDVTLDEDATSQVIAYCDPASAYQSDYYGGTEYASIISMSGFYSSKEDVAESLLTLNQSNPEYVKIRQSTTVVAGHDAILITAEFPADNKAFHEYFLDYGNGECTYICVESTPESIEDVAALVNTYAVSAPTEQL